MYSKLFFILATLFSLSNASPVYTHKNPLHNVRIVGGNETTVEHHPWQVSIQLLGLHSCGGSILDNETIVTAAHCADPLMGLFYTVVAGTTELNNPNLTRVGIRQAIVNPNYSYLDYDIAIIKLSEQLEFNDKIQPVKLPENTNSTPAAGTDVTVSGWGVTWEGGILSSNILREVTVQIVDHQECADSYQQFADVTERMVCAAVDGGGKDACQGDSGGPLTAGDGTLVGIVSWGLGCGQDGYPGVYTDVSNLREWIRDNTGL